MAGRGQNPVWVVGKHWALEQMGGSTAWGNRIGGEVTREGKLVLSVKRGAVYIPVRQKGFDRGYHHLPLLISYTADLRGWGGTGRKERRKPIAVSYHKGREREGSGISCRLSFWMLCILHQYHRNPPAITNCLYWHLKAQWYSSHPKNKELYDIAKVAKSVTVSFHLWGEKIKALIVLFLA